MVFRIVAFLSLAVACMAVTVTVNGTEVDCAPNCACCKGGQSGCGNKPSVGDNYCLAGCVDRIFSHRCKQICPGNCLSCEQAFGNPCYTCKDTFYEVNSHCNKTCSVGCDGGVCNDNGSCSSCKPNFEGNTCRKCIQGKYGATCSLDCVHENCHCTTSNGCDSCKTGFYSNNTFCQTPCSPGCRNGVCNVDGTCDCILPFHGSKCTECSAGYYGTNCDEMCSVGCDNKQCSKDGLCSCRANFNGIKCDSCADESYGENCDKICSIGCASSSCDRNNGFCECDPKFTGDKCEQCKYGFYGTALGAFVMTMDHVAHVNQILKETLVKNAFKESMAQLEQTGM
ncbi:protein draper-like [Mya arenaria]|uniref:protein draper-like n=1 Tax=Mya arenaria TaxID=6604 RepID=UPI0022E139FF|nr:protein draper-like [Mya arenaria]XP_052763476.1 protein draper-like [Mya arenaria]XP_052763477.1 protein draper-like [Mya arenaria]XP_052763478.1 protein draper-like [Mya arenaria]XP_052763479.1 protein draper-like [Mya arenaria]